MSNGLQDAQRQAGELHDEAMLLGYNVGAMLLGYNVGPKVSGDLSQDPIVSFRVWRVDLPDGAQETFATVDDVRAHLARLAALPRYCLELVDNPRVEVVPDENGTATSITDTETGQRFGIRTADLESATRLCVHADEEDPPTIGNWQRI